MLSSRTVAVTVGAICAVLLLGGCEPQTASPSAGSTAPSSAVPGAEPAWMRNLPQGIKDFLVADPAHPFGQPADDAPTESALFGRLAGVWGCRINVTDGTRTIVGWPATWAFKYTAGGYAIEHLYLQDKFHLVPPWQKLARDSHSVALVVYDPGISGYRFLAVNNFAGADIGPSSLTMTGARSGDAISFRPDHQNPARYRRETFYDIEADNFWWRQEESRNRGRSWQTSVRIDCQRRADSPIP